MFFFNRKTSSDEVHFTDEINLEEARKFLKKEKSIKAIHHKFVTFQDVDKTLHIKGQMINIQEWNQVRKSQIYMRS